MVKKTVKLIVPEDVIENAVDEYLKLVFGREVVWNDESMPYRYLIEVEEYFSKPYKIDFESFEVEDEW